MRFDNSMREPEQPPPRPLNEYDAQCAYCRATNPINAERCCACARQNWRRP